MVENARRRESWGEAPGVQDGKRADVMGGILNFDKQG
jgi:hypothetical protein